MKNVTFALGFGYMGLCAVAIASTRLPVALERFTPPVQVVPPLPEAPIVEGAAGWFAKVKPYCNTLEAETAVSQNPPPSGTEGSGFLAACLALGGKIDHAREVLRTVASGARHHAAGIVFEVAHPVADAGDDRSAGPIMALVAEFWPNHYMALYHAGMSEHALGDRAAARRHLEAFLQHYSAEDGWRAAARTALEQLAR